MQCCASASLPRRRRDSAHRRCRRLRRRARFVCVARPGPSPGRATHSVTCAGSPYSLKPRHDSDESASHSSVDVVAVRAVRRSRLRPPAVFTSTKRRSAQLLRARPPSSSLPSRPPRIRAACAARRAVPHCDCVQLPPLVCAGAVASAAAAPSRSYAGVLSQQCCAATTPKWAATCLAPLRIMNQYCMNAPSRSSPGTTSRLMQLACSLARTTYAD